MKAIDIKTLVITGEEGSRIRAYRDNMGEPFREGISIWISKDGAENESGLFLQTYDLDVLIAGLTTLRRGLR